MGNREEKMGGRRGTGEKERFSLPALFFLPILLLVGNANILPGKTTTCFFPDRTSSFPPSNVCHFALQCNQFNCDDEATTEAVKRSL